MSNSNWIRTTKSTCCRKCGKSGWCSYSQDGKAICCRHVDDGTGKEKTDKDGAKWWLYSENNYGTPPPRSVHIQHVNLETSREPEPKIAPPETLHRIYSHLLDELQLGGSHVKNLWDRGIPDYEVTRRGYKSLPKDQHNDLARLLIGEFGEDLCSTVPGVVKKISSRTENPYWTLNASSGILIPVRDVSHRIIAIKVRADETNQNGNRYTYFSSKSFNGPGSGAPVHVPFYDDKSWNIARLTEGEIKADIATILSDIPTISVAGVSSYRTALPTLQHFDVKVLRVAFDSDFRDNELVCQYLLSAIQFYRKNGFEVELETWDGADGCKGIDDLFSKKLTSNVTRGDEVFEMIPNAAPTIFELSAVQESKSNSDLGEVFPGTVPPTSLVVTKFHPEIITLGETTISSVVLGDELEHANLMTRFIREKNYLNQDGFPLIRHYQDEFYLYTGTHYEPVSDGYIRKEVIRWLQTDSRTRSMSGTHNCNEIIANLKAPMWLSEKVQFPLWLNPKTTPTTDATRLIPLRNGILDVDRFLQNSENGDYIIEHTPEFFSLSCLPYDFVRTSECPTFMRVLKEILPEDGKAEFFQEWCGLNLIPDSRFEWMMLLLGEGSNGKSLLIDVLKALIGVQNYSGVSLEAFDPKRTFGMIPMVGKLANIATEMNEIDKANEGLLKQIITGEALSLEKKFKNAFLWHPSIHLTFATNNFPRFRDRTNGIWRRITIIPFTQTFTVENGNIDIRFKDKDFWIKNGEMSGIFNWALEGLCRLVLRGKIDEPLCCKDAKNEQRRECSPALQFFEEMCEADSESEISSHLLYSAYCDYVGKNNNKPLAKSAFGREIKRAFPEAVQPDRVERLSNGRRTRIWQGIKLHGIYFEDDLLQSILVNERMSGL